MSKLIYILFLLIGYTAYSQSLSVFNVDASSFPTIKAKFYAFDAAGNQITNLSNSDFTLTENGQTRTVTNVSCPTPKPPIALSSVLVMDASGSMSSGNLDLAKEAAKAWIEGLPLGKSECAITAFDSENYLIQDFTTDRTLLLQKANSLSAGGGTDYDAAMLNLMAGGLLITKNAKHKRVIVFLSDGWPNQEPQTSKIISEGQAQNVKVYVVTLNMPTPQCLKDIALQTGGQYYENVTTIDEARSTYSKLLQMVQGGAPCQIEWQSAITCKTGMVNVSATVAKINLTSHTSYQSPIRSIAKLEFSPTSVKFQNFIPGINKDTTITVTARNANFNVTNITSTNSAYSITPTHFFLNSGESRDLKVSYLPLDSGYTYTELMFENNICPALFYASGGFPGKKAKIQTLKLIQPNGGEFLAVGNDTLITWEGVLPEEKVKIEYSTDNGVNWILITENATGLAYKWRVPNTPSNLCLARVTSKTGYEPDCIGVFIGNQLWMGCNLDFDTYLDGTPIPEVTDPTEWANLTTGAWCYYNNDPAMGAIYGKLYNWYAVNDPRGLAPVGWHIPSDAEWTVLSNCLGGEKIAGGKLKSTGTVEAGDGLWYAPNTGATNESGFSALPGGYRTYNGSFNNKSIGNRGYWWCSTVRGTEVWFRFLDCTYLYLLRSYYTKENGYSVRCIRD